MLVDFLECNDVKQIYLVCLEFHEILSNMKPVNDDVQLVQPDLKNSKRNFDRR